MKMKLMCACGQNDCGHVVHLLVFKPHTANIDHTFTKKGHTKNNKKRGNNRKEFGPPLPLLRLLHCFSFQLNTQ